MRKFCSICILLSILSIITKGQNHFDFNDTLFTVGQTMKINVHIDLSGKQQVSIESYPLIDSITSFLKDHENLCVEFGVHLRFMGDSAQNKRFSEIWAECIYEIVLFKGIDSSRISYKGFGNDTLIIVDEKINDKYKFLKIGQPLNEEYFKSLDTNEERQIVFNLNYIAEIRIKKINWP